MLLPLIFFRDFTPANELRYLSIADEALRNGNFFTFTNHGLPYADKPPLYFWIIMLSKVLFGQFSMWFMALFSIIPALIIQAVMTKWTRNELTLKYQYLTKLMLITSALFLGAAIFLRMDMLMCMFIVLSLYTFYKMYSGTGTRWDSWLFPVYLFLGVFTKGPNGIIIPLLSIIFFLLYKKELKTFGKYFGLKTLAVIVAGCTVWFGAVWLEAGSSYLNNLVFNQTINRAVDSFDHAEPFYYYFLTIWYTFAPWSLLILSTLILGVRKKVIQTDIEKFFMVIILTTVIFHSLLSSKIEIYLLPVYPFMVYLSVSIIRKISWTKWLSFTVLVPAVITIFALPAYLFLKYDVTSSMWSPDVNSYGVTALIVLSIFGLISTYYLIKKRDPLHSAYAIACGILLFVFIASWNIPPFNDALGYKEVSIAGKSLSKGEDQQYIAYGVGRSENMDVFLGKPVWNMPLEDILAGKYSGSILFIKNKRIKDNPEIINFLSDKRVYTVGKISIVPL